MRFYPKKSPFYLMCLMWPRSAHYALSAVALMITALVCFALHTQLQLIIKRYHDATESLIHTVNGAERSIDMQALADAVRMLQEQQSSAHLSELRCAAVLERIISTIERHPVMLHHLDVAHQDRREAQVLLAISGPTAALQQAVEALAAIAEANVENTFDMRSENEQSLHLQMQLRII